jgi:hypothetical protein
MRVMSGLKALPGEDDEGKQEESEEQESEEKTKKKGKKGKKKEDDMPEEDMSFTDALQESMQSTMYIFPIMTMVISASFPSGLALYWTVNSGFVIIQQIIVNWKKVTNNFSEILTKINPF